MKRLIIPVLAVILLAGCGKELSEKANALQGAEGTKLFREKGINPAIPSADDSTGSSGGPVSNVLPCAYYPPGSPFSCNPEAVSDDPLPVFPAIALQNGYLSFSSLNDFTMTYDILDSLLENFTGYDYAMGLFNGNLDRIDSLLDVRGIDESGSLRNFESRFSGYYSLRKDVEARENSFLDNGGNPASAQNPENVQFVNDDVFRTLLNKDGVVAIENIILKVFQNGVTYAIMNNSSVLLNKLQHPEWYGLASYPEYFSTHYCSIDTANILLLTPQLLCEQATETIGNDFCSKVGRYAAPTGPSCKLWYSQNCPAYYYDNNKRVSVSKISVYNMFVYDVGISKIRNYKIKPNGKWKATRTNLGAYISEDGCSLYNKNRSVKYRKFRLCSKRDVTIIPGLGGVFRGLRWMAENIAQTTNSSGYYRYFKTATNHVFYGKNYCNGSNNFYYANW